MSEKCNLTQTTARILTYPQNSKFHHEARLQKLSESCDKDDRGSVTGIITFQKVNKKTYEPQTRLICGFINQNSYL